MGEGAILHMRDLTVEVGQLLSLMLADLHGRPGPVCIGSS